MTFFKTLKKQEKIKKRKMSSKFRNACFTSFDVDNLRKIWNNPDETKCERVAYLCMGLEKCPTTGRLHWQGMIQLENAYAIKGIQKIIGDPKCHIEKMKGTAEESYDYCRKDDAEFIEFGELRKKSKRIDIDNVKSILKVSNSVKCVAEVATCLQHIKFAETYMKYMDKPRTSKPTVKWFYGKTGCGKTKLAYELLPNAYIKDGTKWWEAYDGEKDVIIDDIRSDTFPFQILLQILDRFPYRCEIKGGSRQLQATNIIITAPSHPRKMFEGISEDINQLLRRIDEIKFFGNGNGNEVDRVILEPIEPRKELLNQLFGK